MKKIVARSSCKVIVMASFYPPLIAARTHAGAASTGIDCLTSLKESHLSMDAIHSASNVC
jgi:hypothetical protein